MALQQTELETLKANTARTIQELNEQLKEKEKEIVARSENVERLNAELVILREEKETWRIRAEKNMAQTDANTELPRMSTTQNGIVKRAFFSRWVLSCSHSRV